MFNELESEISHAEIECACKQLKNNRSGGADFLYFRYVREKNAAQLLVQTMLELVTALCAKIIAIK